MKLLNKFIIITFTLFIALFGIFYTSYASEGSKEFLVIKEMIYKNNRQETLTSGFVEVKLGRINFVAYQEDIELKITPEPDEIKKDDYDNYYAYYNTAGFGPGTELKVIIERKVKSNSYELDIPTNTYTLINEETELYLEEQTRVESDNKDILKKAEEITKAKSSDYSKARDIFEYVNTQIEYVEDPQYANRGAISALETHKGVCEEFATLYVALCRAVEIPARVIEGYKIETNKIKNPDTGELENEYNIINHAWAEIYLEEYGWIPVEPTIIYTVGGERKPYFNAFGNISEPNYIALGVYNYDRANRTMKYVREIQYSERIQDLMTDEIKPYTFTDITQEYQWSENSIKRLYNLSVINGYNEREYGPGRNISRIEFICMLSRTLKNMNFSRVDTSGIYYYMDYDRNHWSKNDYDYLMQCYQAVNPSDIMSAGYYSLANVFGTSINVDKPITRGEVVALMNDFMKNIEAENIFSDVSDNIFFNSIIKSYANGLIMGYPDGTFKPDNLITRAEMATILDRFLESNSYIYEPSV